MAQFDVYANPSPATRDAFPYLLDLQSDLLEPMATRVVAPLLAADDGVPAARTLMPSFQVEGIEVVMSTAELAGVSRSELGPRIASLEQHRAEILAALDMLFTGISSPATS